MNSGLTQIHRKTVSAPMREIAERLQAESIIHFGEGRAYQDTAALAEIAPTVVYDPNSPQKSKREWPETWNDVGVAIYVFNTLPPLQRSYALQDFLSSCDRWYIAVRADKVDGTPLFDGVMTKRGTFQKRYTEAEAVREFGGTVIKKTSTFILLYGTS